MKNNFVNSDMENDENSLMYGNIKNKLRQFITEQELKQNIGEGLIMTHNIDKVNDFLQRFLSNTYHISINKESWIIVLLKKDPNDRMDDTFIINYLNNWGYYLSAYLKDDKVLKTDYPNNDYDGMRFEPKYDREVILKGRYLYHVTEKRNVDKILKIGLTPKTKSKLTNHPDRIYLALTDNDANDITQIFLRDKLIKEPVKLKIDTHGLHNRFLLDTQFEGGVYTLHNIPPTNISVVQN